MATPPRTWDLEYDVVVGGYGYAGAVAAIFAHDAGAKVGLLEKMSHPGGNSILSGGSCLVARNAASARTYMERTSGGATDSEVIAAFADGLAELPDMLARLADEVGFETVVEWRGGTYPFPGGEDLGNVKVTRNQDYQGFPWAKGTKAGGTLFWVISKQVERRTEIDVRYGTGLRELVTLPDGTVAGVVAEVGGTHVYVHARRAVVLATGGFEHNERLKLHYMQIQHTLSASPPGNTGDGVLMAQAAGAALWHMWHVHGGYGFKVPELSVAVRHSFEGPRKADRPMPWIVVDQDGRRFMNECPPAPQDTSIRSLEFYDPDRQCFPRIPCWLVFDETGRQLGPIGAPKINEEGVDFGWSQDNLEEVKKGYIRTSPTLAGLATQLNVDGDVLQAEVMAWNEGCLAGRDLRFRRPATTMMPLSTPPFYAIEGWPVVTNTQGGPVHNASQQIVDPFGRPIPRLYAAGELGSIFGHLYVLAGNNAECLIGGRIAGERAAEEPPWRTGADGTVEGVAGPVGHPLPA